MVRQAKITDLASVAKIHMDCFPGTVTSSLGKLWNGRIVVDYYKEYYSDSPELFLVAENNSGKVVGFCMGYKFESGNIDKRLIKHHLIKIVIGYFYLLLTGDKECWRKLKSCLGIGVKIDSKVITLEPKINQTPNTEKAELFTIGLYGDYRGLSYGKDLILAYFDACKSNFGIFRCM